MFQLISFSRKYCRYILAHFHCIHAAKGVDPSVFINQTVNPGVEPLFVEPTGNDTIVGFPQGCPVPEPFIINLNFNTAFLRGDNFNGTQPEDAGIYICYVNGLPSATIEVVVLGMIACNKAIHT